MYTQIEHRSDQNFGRPQLASPWDSEDAPPIILDRFFKRFLKIQPRKRHSKAGRCDGRTKLAMPSEELDQASSEALAARFGGDRRGHGGRSAAEGRPSGPPSSTTCSCRTPARLAATLPEARPRSFSTGARAATSSLQFFSDTCRTLLPSRVATHAHHTRCPRAGVALSSTTRRAFRAAQVEHRRTLIVEWSGTVWLPGCGWRHRRWPGAAGPSPLGGWTCPAARGARARVVCVERGRADP